MNLYITNTLIIITGGGVSRKSIPFSRLSRFTFNEALSRERYTFHETGGETSGFLHDQIKNLWIDGVKQDPIPDAYRPDGTGLSTIIENRLVANAKAGLQYYIFPADEISEGQTVFNVPVESLVLDEGYLFVVNDFSQRRMTTRSGQAITWPAGASLGDVIEVYN